jgi:hypothetical protein
VVTSGALTAGQWNWVPLSAPFSLAIGTCYNACTGFTGSFPNTKNQFGSRDPYVVGLVNGPLTAYSDTSGSLRTPYTTSQGVFGVTGTNPSVNMPLSGSSSANFWLWGTLWGAVTFGGICQFSRAICGAGRSSPGRT